MRTGTPIVPLVLALAAMTACGSPRVDLAAEESAVRTRSEGVVAAEMDMDIDKAVTYFAEDAIVQPGGMPQIQGKESIGEFYGHMSELGFTDFSSTSSYIEVAPSGALAYEYGINRMVFPSPEGDLLDMGKYLTVWKKIEGEWYIQALAFSSDAPAPVPMEGN